MAITKRKQQQIDNHRNHGRSGFISAVVYLCCLFPVAGSSSAKPSPPPACCCCSVPGGGGIFLCVYQTDSKPLGVWMCCNGDEKSATEQTLCFVFGQSLHSPNIMVTTCTLLLLPILKRLTRIQSYPTDLFWFLLSKESTCLWLLSAVRARDDRMEKGGKTLAAVSSWTISLFLLLMSYHRVMTEYVLCRHLETAQTKYYV
mgnify:CR=1 FL=1